MKASILLLLVVILLVGVANLLFTMGLIGSSAHEYVAYPAQKMDEIGFRKLAEANGIEVSEEGQIKFPQELREQMLKHNMLPFTISEIEKEGWRFVSVTVDNHYLFQKR